MTDTENIVSPFDDVDQEIPQPESSGGTSPHDLSYDGGMTLEEVQEIEDPAQRFFQATVEIDYTRKVRISQYADERAKAAAQVFKMFGGHEVQGAQTRAAKLLGIDRGQMNQMLAKIGEDKKSWRQRKAEAEQDRKAS